MDLMENAMSKPHNVIREGFKSAISTIGVSHPVEEIQRNHLKNEMKSRVMEVERNFGIGAALMVKMEQDHMASVHRLPGIPSSFVGLETALGSDTDFDVTDCHC